MSGPLIFISHSKVKPGKLHGCDSLKWPHLRAKCWLDLAPLST